jgi:hypothetical protein
MREIVIAPQQEGKGRTFSATCLATVEADSLWTGGMTGDNMRPVWAMFAGSEQELRPFIMNLKSGRKASFLKSRTYSRSKDEKLEILKSSGLEVTWQREIEGSIATVYLPDLFQLNPGMVDTKGASFIVLPTVAWAREQRIDDVAAIVRHVRDMIPLNYEKAPYLTDEEVADLVPTAFLFCSYLDFRTRCPLLSDARFYMQLLIACLQEGLASFAIGDNYYYNRKEFGRHSHFRFSTQGLPELGFSTPIAFTAEHAAIERVLAEQVTLFFEKTGG